MADKQRINLLSWNVNGLRAIMKKGFPSIVTDLNPDILLLQETKLQQDQRTEEMIRMKGYDSFWAYATVKKGYSGVAAFSKLTPDTVITEFSRPEIDREGRIIQMDFDRFTLFNIYFPNGQMSDERLQYKLDFYDWFLSYSEALRSQGRNIIIAGDFNTAHREIDLKNPGPNAKRSGFLPVEREVLDRMASLGYVDTFRHFYPDEVKYTWWSYRFNARKNNAGWRIDYFFATKELMDTQTVKDAFINNEVYGSDHCPAGIVIDL